MLKNLVEVGSEYRKWRGDWDALCNRCGRCCYPRSRASTGEVVVDYTSPCEFLDTKTRQCSVFETRFRACKHCGRVNLFRALFHPTLPADCAYVKTFRVWSK